MLTLGANLYEKEEGVGFFGSTGKNNNSVAITTSYQTSAEKMSSDAMIVPGKIRPAVKPHETRQLMTATIPKNAITTALRIALPAGVALSAALREVFQLSVFESREAATALEDGFKTLNKKSSMRKKFDASKMKKKEYNQRKRNSMEF